MHWKTKALVQNVVSIFPSSASYEAYYLLQRHFGGLKKINPVSRLKAGIATWNFIKKNDYDPVGKVFFEIGTGRIPNVPMAYWLMGAEKTITIDLNPYLKEDLVRECLQYIHANYQNIQKLFGPLLDQRRMDDLLAFHKSGAFSVQAFLDLCRIQYIAPGDAANTKMQPRSIDFHTSYTVFEHIPLEVLRNIVEEGGRIITDDGLFVHRIDYSDHFSHSDKTIPRINFLRYSNKEWNRYAGNRYMYMNRLRHDDYISLFRDAGHHILDTRPDVEPHLQEMLRGGGFPLDQRFKTKTEEVLATTGAWIVSKKTNEQKIGASIESGASTSEIN